MRLLHWRRKPLQLESPLRKADEFALIGWPYGDLAAKLPRCAARPNPLPCNWSAR
jgi:hypothetical protein